MSIVKLNVNGRDYHLDCSEDQRPRLDRLARIVEDRARSLAESGAAEAGVSSGEDQERRFLLLTALLLADRLLDAEVKAVELEEALTLSVAEAAGRAASRAETPARESPREEAPREEAPEGPESEEPESEPLRETSLEASESAAELPPELAAAVADLLDSATARMNAISARLENA